MPMDPEDYGREFGAISLDGYPRKVLKQHIWSRNGLQGDVVAFMFGVGEVITSD